MNANGWMIDADSGRRHVVSVSAQGHSLVIDRDDGRRQSFVPGALFPIMREDGTEIYGLEGVPRFRLGLTVIEDRLVEARLPAFPAKPARRRPVMALAMLAAAACGLAAAGLALPY